MSEIKEKSWEEFRDIGLLWLVNSILHLFGWSIVFEIEEGTLIKVFPARVPYRGFDERSNSEGYLHVTEYLCRNAEELLEEAEK